MQTDLCILVKMAAVRRCFLAQCKRSFVKIQVFSLFSVPRTAWVFGVLIMCIEQSVYPKIFPLFFLQEKFLFYCKIWFFVLHLPI